MNRKVVNFYYKRDSLPHSEFAAIQSLAEFFEDDTRIFYKISTSTAAIFDLVRAFCLKNKIDLIAKYEDLDLILDKNMRMCQWSNCPDFEITDNALGILLFSAEDF
jgi:hypothetical protein